MEKSLTSRPNYLNSEERKTVVSEHPLSARGPATRGGDNLLLRGYMADLDTLTIRDISESEIEATLGPASGAEREQFERQVPLTESRIATPPPLPEEGIPSGPPRSHRARSPAPSTSADFQEMQELTQPYSELPTLGREASHSKELDEKWTTIPDLDDFFSAVYHYYRQGGYRAILTRNLLNIVLLLFLAHLTAFVVLCVDWRKLLLNCQADCQLEDVIHWGAGGCGWLAVFVQILYLAVVFYVLWGLLALCLAMQQAGHMRSLFLNEFGIPDSQLGFHSWEDVLEQLAVLQEKYEFCKVKRELTKLDIVARIGRLDNYMVGMVESGVLEVGGGGRAGCARHQLNKLMRGQCRRRKKNQRRGGGGGEDDAAGLVKRRGLSQSEGRGVCLTRVWVWALRVSLLQSLFRKDYPSQLNRAALSPARLKTKFCCLGALLVLLAAPLALCAVLLHLLKSAHKFQSKSSSNAAASTASQRAWTPYAFWRLRGYNELPHQIDSRLALTQPPAELLATPSSAKRMLFKFLALLSATAFALILLLSLFDDALAKALFWYMAIAGILTNLFAALAASTPTPQPDTPSLTAPHANTHARTLIDHTHLEPNRRVLQLESLRHYLWNMSLDPTQPYLPAAPLQPLESLISSQFQSRHWLLLKELASILLLPWLFLGILMPRARAISNLILNHTLHVEGVGDVYCFSTLDLTKYRHPALAPASEEPSQSDDEYEISQSTPQLRMRKRNSSTEIQIKARRGGPPRPPKDLKMEKSYLAFLIRHGVGGHTAMADLLRKVCSFEQGEEGVGDTALAPDQVSKKRYFAEVRERERRIHQEIQQHNQNHHQPGGGTRLARSQLYQPSPYNNPVPEEQEEEAAPFQIEEAFGQQSRSVFQSLDVYAFERYLE